MQMHTRSRQRGLGWFGLLFVLGTIAFVSLITIKAMPVYLNHMKITSSVKKVAQEEANAKAELFAIHKALNRYWSIESIDSMKPTEVKVKRTEAGRFLVYEYERRVPLFYNISLLFEFKGQERMAAAG